MQQLLVVVIRGILPEKVRIAITHFCFLFNAICSKVIDPRQLDDLENEATIVLCQLEMYFPPSFFDIMVHLINIDQKLPLLKGILLKKLLFFVPSTLRALNMLGFLKVIMTG